ncbi:Polysaccharide chain length determinant N-terminal domain containing protein [Methylophilaceae bacterium]
MQTPDNNLPAHSQRSDDDEINLMDIMLVIAKYNRFIMAFTAASIVLALIYVMLQPFSYTAKTVILPPQPKSDSSMGALLGNLGGLNAIPGSGALGLKNPSDMYLGMLKSRTLADRVIVKLDLQKHYKTKTMTKTREVLKYASNIAAGKDGFITVEYTHSDPVMAANIANAYIRELDSINSTLAVTEAAKRRLFYEKQIKETSVSLSQAEAAMKQTQRKTGWYEFGGFDVAMAAGGAGGGGSSSLTSGGARVNASVLMKVEEIRAQITLKELDLASKRAYMTEQNPAYVRSLATLAALKANLTKLEGSTNASGADVKVPVNQLSDTGFAYIHQMRDLKYKQSLMELYSKQFEMAKMDEAKESPLVQVVDKAMPPEERSAPKRAQMMVIATLLALVISIMLAFIMNALDTAKQKPESAERLNLLRRYLQRGK